MPAITSQVQANSPTFRANSERMLSLLQDVRDLEEKVRNASSAKREKFEQRGQLLPRARIAALLDRGSEFLELSSLAGLRMHDDDGESAVLGGGSIIGIGTVSGRRCALVTSDSAIKGGTIPPMGLRKTLRIQELARKQKLPMLYLVESGGANLLYQSEIFVEGGRTFANQARLSAAGIPQIAVVHGSSTAGGAYLPGLSDYTIVVRDRSKIFLAGPPLVKAAMGEDASDEELGGAQLHAEHTGLAEYITESDEHALQLARDLLATMRWPAVDSVPSDAAPPLYDPAELIGVVPENSREPYDVREVVARLVDGSDFLEFKQTYAPDTVCGHARISGYPVGIIGNNGPIQPAGSTKAGQFIQLCDQTGTSLLFLQNTTGYMVGKKAERDGAIKHGAKMIQAVANARVPKITIVLGGSYGAGNYGMCGRGFDPDFLFSWPTARTSVMGGEQAAKVMEIITLAKLRRMGHTANPEDVQSFGAPLREQLDAESHVLFGTARLWDDGVIDPRDTRRLVAQCLQITDEARSRELCPNTFGVARF